MDATRFTYIGPPPFAEELAQELQTRGISVDYEPPMEKRDFSTALTVVELPFTVIGSVPAIRFGVRAFMRRFSRARIEVSKLPLVASATLWVPKAVAKSRLPAVAVASLPLPRAIARSPVPEVAVALPNWSNVNPSTETATFGVCSDGSAEASRSRELVAEVSCTAGT